MARRPAFQLLWDIIQVRTTHGLLQIRLTSEPPIVHVSLYFAYRNRVVLSVDIFWGLLHFTEKRMMAAVAEKHYTRRIALQAMEGGHSDADFSAVKESLAAKT